MEAARAPMRFVRPALVRVVVAIDPAASSGEDADETGIIVAGKDKDSRGYVLADLSGHHTPIEWARIAVAAYKSHGADRIVAEVNNGGEMVEATLRVVDDKRRLYRSARHPRQGGAGRTGGGALRAGPHPAHRRLHGARRPDVRGEAGPR